MSSNVSHQAYTLMMKVTVEGRPFVKDIHDLFATLIIQNGLDTHRSLFRSYPTTFTTEEAVQNLGDLKFSHTTKSADPADPKRDIITTTTTTFSMTKEMAKTLCQHFLEARLIESATDISNRTSFRDKGIWLVTPKGLCILEDFCSRTVVDVTHLREPLSRVVPIKVIMVERHSDDDQLALNRKNILILFKIMMGSITFEESRTNEYTASDSQKESNRNYPEVNIPFSILQPATEDISEVGNRILNGNKLLTTQVSQHRPTLRKHRANLEKYANAFRGLNRRNFNGSSCCEWILDHTTVVSRGEAEIIAAHYLQYGWIEPAAEKTAPRIKDDSKPFKSSKSAIYCLTDNGRGVVSWEQELRNSDLSSNDAQSVLSGPEPEQAGLVQKAKDQALLIRTPTDQDSNLVGYVHKDTEAASRIVPHVPPPPYSRQRPPSTIDSRGSNLSNFSYTSSQHDTKESNATKLQQILNDPNLRSLFKSFLRANFCEENLDFWIDHNNLLRKYRVQSPALTSRNQSDLLEDAYAIYTTYLAAGSPNELNIEHSLRQEMARFVSNIVTILPSYIPGEKSKLVISAHGVSHSLRTMMKMLQKVDDHICRLMATDSVPKFVRTRGYLRIVNSKERQSEMSSFKLETGDLNDDVLDDSLEEDIENLEISSNNQRPVSSAPPKANLI
ncbi:regulator of G protein signaling domain-containing protein [Umbelopsis sp. PMI_123]|nr:regulator of G protein signaling domain-containing protein [Umbelopsis sp. PMI_123]